MTTVVTPVVTMTIVIPVAIKLLLVGPLATCPGGNSLRGLWLTEKLKFKCSSEQSSGSAPILQANIKCQ